jgi:hypothetical protein
MTGWSVSNSNNAVIAMARLCIVPSSGLMDATLSRHPL